MTTRTAALVRFVLALAKAIPVSFVLVAAQEAGGAKPAAPPGPVRRLPDGKPDLSGFYQSDGGGANYGLERKERDFLTPASRGVITATTAT